MRRPRPLIQRLTLSLLLVGVIFVGTVSPIAVQPARAQWVVTDPVTGANTTIKNIWDYLLRILGGGVAVAVMNGMGYIAQKLAYDTAVFIASGGKGEGTLFESKNIGDLVSDVALGGVGEALGTLSEQGFAGFNLCNPTVSGPSLNISIMLGIAGTAGAAPRPRCEWNDIAKNWDTFITSVETGEALRGTFLSFQPGQSELSVGFGSNIKVLEYAGKKVNEALEENRIGEGFKSLVNPISGTVKTPSVVVAQEAKRLTERAEKKGDKDAAIIGPAIGAGFASILPAALATFTNTLTSTLLNRIFTEGLFDIKTVTCPGFDLFSDVAGKFGVDFGALGSIGNTECALTNPEFAGRGGRAAAQAAFADFLTPRIIESQPYDAISEFTVCPDQFRTPSNCVLDSQFAAAVRQAQVDRPLTVQEALDRGYLHGDWPLVSSNGADQARNSDPFCFTTGYCYSNLVKLRKARVIPIGWELAAAKATNGSPTLKQVIDGFNNCPPADAPTTEATKYCHLIDPNWLLKYPVTQCKARVNGPTLLTAESDLRAQICVDTPSCIAESEDGTCESGYGYCTREKNIWRLGGDECPGQFATCAAYTDRRGASVSLLSNTVDRGICTADNVGCRGYSLAQDPADGSGDWSLAGRVFLDRDAGTCEERDAGCSELYPRKTARVNLVRNSSFEQDQDGDTLPDSWAGVVTERADSFVDSGIYSVRPSAAADLSQTVWLEAGRTYTLSASAGRNNAETAVTVNLDLSFRNRRGAAVSLAGVDTTCDAIGGNILRLPLSPAADSFERLGCRFTLPDNPIGDVGAALDFAVLSVRSAPGPDAWLDSVQIEEGPVFSSYHEEVYADASASYLRLPPDFLNCTGDPATDNPACADYSGVCRADEVGCERYTPADGSPPVPGIIADTDRCPAECVGYATYRQEPASFDVGRFPQYFIPSTARQCTASAAGCSEFTNLDALSGGGEAREYYSSLRACVKPGAGSEGVYYTWEGSDTAGYQLKEWRFVSGDPLPGRDEEVGTRPPKLVSETYAGACTAEIYAAGGNPDCREFYDTSGNRSYRPYSRTVVVSSDCHPYRITEPAVDQTIADQAACGVAGGEWLGPSNQCVICAPFGGTWNPAANECVYQGLPSESASCSQAESGCRLFTGNAGRNVRVVFQDDFESGGPARRGWSEAGTAVSAESTVVGEHSLRVDAGTDLSKDVSSASEAPIFQGGTYYLSFWAKGRGNLSAGFSGGARAEFAAGTIALGGNWQVYNFGPVFLNRPVVAGESLVFSGFADTSFIDNIILRQVDEAIAVVKNSWVTPTVCDQTREGAALPQAMLGCAGYTDRQGTDHALTGFASLCRDAAVGCTAFADTRASDSPGRETWNAMCVVGAPAASPTACEVAGNTVCTVGTGLRSCRYKSDGVVPPVTCDLGSEDFINSRPCSIDGVFICDVPASRHGFAPVTSCRGVPADTVVVPEDATRFIIEDQKFQCAPEKVGCADAGLPKQAVCALPDGADAGDDPDACAASSCDCRLDDGSLACQVASGETACRFPLPFREPYPSGATLSFEPAVVQNAPRTYERSLCVQSAVGCEEWTSSGSEGGLAYFKAPDDRLCQYRENVNVAGTEIDGWFREGTDLACDPGFIIGGTTYGLRRNGDPEYRGFAGQCEEQFAGCTEFRDPSDKNAVLYPRGKPYYAIKNNKLDTTTCDANVSRTTGCILFEDTSNSLLTASTDLTYARSAADDFVPVAAVSCEGGSCGQCQYRRPQSGNRDCKDIRWGSLCLSDADCAAGGQGETGTCEFAVSPANLNTYGGDGAPNCTDAVLDATGAPVSLPVFWALYRGGRNDSNTVIKVRQDRVCGEWLSCRSKSPVWDQQTGNFKEVCNQVGVCDAYSGSGESIECTHWITDRTPQILSEDIYRNRDLAASLEYSGYSIPHQYPVDSLEQVTVGRFCTMKFIEDAEDPNFGGRKPCESALADCGGVGECLPEQRLVHVLGTTNRADGESCTDPEGREHGTAYSNKCVVSVSGNSDPAFLDQPEPLQIAGENRNDTVASCRAYPEQNSPFPGSIMTERGSTPVVVSTWNEQGSGDTENPRPATPVVVVNGFQKSKICEKDQDCECSYLKATYGSAGVIRYFNPIAAPYDGLCQGGARDGRTCTTNDNCVGPPKEDGTPSTDVGTCNLLTRKDNVQGLEGYCLERDLSTPINGQQFPVGDLASRACNTWLPADRLAGSADIYNNFAAAGFNPGGNVYACAVPEVYKISEVYGAHRGPIVITRNIDGTDFTISAGCWETSGDGQVTDIVLLHGRTEDQLDADDSDPDPTEFCGEEDGFVIVSRVVVDNENVDNDDTTIDCHQEDGDDDHQWMCVPNNSVHQMVPGKPPCRPEDAGEALVNGFAGGNPRFKNDEAGVKGRNPNVYIVQGGGTGKGFLDHENEKIPGPFADRGNVLDVFADCQTNDAEIDGIQNSKNKGELYLGCQDVVQVAKAGENPKAVTGKLGSGRVAPPGSGLITTNPRVRTVEYNWHSPPPPFGIVNTNDISRVTDSINAPVQLAYCPGPLAVLPKADAEQGADTVQCVELQTTSDLHCKSIGESCNEEDYDTCIDAITKNDSCGSNAIPIIGWCDLRDNGTDPDLDNKCEIAVGNDRCPYRCIPLESFHNNRAPCDVEINSYASETNSGKRYIRIDGVPDGSSDYNRLSNSRFNDCTREEPASAEALYGIPEQYKARPYIDVRFGTEIDELTGEECDNAGNCRDYGADQVGSFSTKIKERLGQLFTQVFREFRYYPRNDSHDGEYREVQGSDLVYADVAAEQGRPPVVAAAGDCFEGARCIEGATGALTVNGLTSGDVVGGGGQFGVELKFYAYAQNDQMPIRQIVVDWGDGTRDGPYPGSYKNHRGFRRAASGHESLCANTDFGTSPEACDDSSPFVYAYTYTCDTDANGLAVCPAGASSCDASRDVTRDGVKDCVYNVRVQVKDNWGFCNGNADFAQMVNSCPGNPALGYCYDASDVRGFNECMEDFADAKDQNIAPWTAFSGRIVVSPR